MQHTRWYTCICRQKTVHVLHINSKCKHQILFWLLIIKLWLSGLRSDNDCDWTSQNFDITTDKLQELKNKKSKYYVSFFMFFSCKLCMAQVFNLYLWLCHCLTMYTGNVIWWIRVAYPKLLDQLTNSHFYVFLKIKLSR